MLYTLYTFIYIYILKFKQPQALFPFYNMQVIAVSQKKKPLQHTMCPDKMMTLHASSLTQQKVLNYSGSSLASHTDHVSQQIEQSQDKVCKRSNNMTITPEMLFVYVATF